MIHQLILKLLCCVLIKMKMSNSRCLMFQHYRGSYKSLNTGIITLMNYGKHVPPAVSHVTMAHEMGHNFGSPHDPETDESCVPGGENGNYIMFARATSGDKYNNKRFSPCSLRSIHEVLTAKARGPKGCFTGKSLHWSVACKVNICNVQSRRLQSVVTEWWRMGRSATVAGRKIVWSSVAGLSAPSTVWLSYHAPCAVPRSAAPARDPAATETAATTSETSAGMTTGAEETVTVMVELSSVLPAS